jgi:hypothetical protein
LELGGKEMKISVGLLENRKEKRKGKEQQE